MKLTLTFPGKSPNCNLFNDRLPGLTLHVGGSGSGTAVVRSEALLVAAGRKAQKLEALALEKAGVKWNKDGT